MEITVQNIADMLDASVEGDPNVTITGPSKIEEGTPGTLTFLANGKYESYLYTSGASAALVHEDFTPKEKLSMSLIRVKDVYASLQLLLTWYEQRQSDSADAVPSSHEGELPGIHPEAQIAEDAHIGPHCIIELGAVIGSGATLVGQVYVGAHARIGERCTLHPGVRLMKGCILGNSCQIYANAVIGSDGFGYTYEDGYKKIPQIGIVRIGDRVEVGANATIDRAVMGETVIEDGVIIDNLVHIAHNVHVGEHTAIAAQTGVAGSAKIGNGCRIGGQVGIVGHIKLGDKTEIQAQSGIMRHSAPGDRLFGSPAIPYNDYLRSYAVFKRLPDMMDELRTLRKQVADLSAERHI